MVSHPHIKGEGWVPESPDSSFSSAPYKIHNIGNSKPVKLTSFIEAIEKALGKKAQWQMMPIQAGDVEKTWADVSTLKQDYNYNPGTPVETGIQLFIEWYREYYNL
jgi:UDP-glucuronate 4-epimerase